MIVDQTGNLSGVSRHDYLPFGEELFAGVGGRTSAQGYSATDGVRQHFTGYEMDAETGLNFAQARYQSSVQGRFTSVDPLGASANVLNPQSFNRYSYVHNNPINFVDPTGMSLLDIGVVQTTDPSLANTLQQKVDENWMRAINAQFALEHGGSVTYDKDGKATFLPDQSQNPGEVPFTGYFDDCGILTWRNGANYRLPNERAPTSRDGDLISALFGGSDIEITLESPEQRTQRLMENGEEWDQWYKWQNCAHPIWVEYEQDRDQYLKAMRMTEVLAAIGSGAAAYNGSPIGAILPMVGVINQERTTFRDKDRKFERDIINQCGAKPRHPEY
jgi:RHS repeat-associated protein